ncbi:unnamed protein product [Boreogadus saida]
MPVARMKMRPWLENMIESNKVPGLSWVDKDQKMFAITWKHAARHGWQVEKDASLFKHWAIHTGKFKEGVDESDPKKWKANFRCAMNSLPDVEQVKGKNVNKGQQAVRVYKMVAVTATKDRRTKTKDGKRRNKLTKARLEETDFSDTQSCEDQHPPHYDDTCSPQENTIDSTEQDMISLPLSASEVPDFENVITIGYDSNNTEYLYRRFEVSPEHSPEFEDAEELLKLCQQLEPETNWMQSSSDDRLSSGLHSDSNYSPHSQWSDASSGEDLDMRLYTDLSTGTECYSPETWNMFPTPQYQQINFHP